MIRFIQPHKFRMFCHETFIAAAATFAIAASPQAKTEAARSQLAAVKANLQSHRAEIAFAQSELARITSLVSSRAINAAMQDEKQQKLQAAKAALLSAEADVQSAEALIKLGQAVELRPDSLKDQIFTGEVKRTAGQLDKRTRTLRVEAEVEDKEGKLRPGMYGMVVTTVSPE